MSLPSLRALLPAIHECAGLAMGYYRGEVSLGAELKGDQTLVTEADRRVEALLRRAIGELDPSARIVGEEGGVGRRGAGRLTFAIDPIACPGLAPNAPCIARIGLPRDIYCRFTFNGAKGTVRALIETISPGGTTTAALPAG